MLCIVKTQDPVAGDPGGSSIPAEVEAAFVGSCALSGCHDAGTRAGGLSLAAADLESLVGKPSSGSPLPLVVLGDVHGSYLAIKMLPDDVISTNGLERTGARMPTTQDYANPNNATILAWIAGAEFPDAGSTDTDTDTSTGDGVLNFDDIAPILVEKCSCHQVSPDEATNGSVSFPAAADLIGVPSVDVPTMNLVEPGEPENSYLWHKLEDTQASVMGSGAKMPLGAPLTDGELMLIEDWILAGAPE